MPTYEYVCRGCRHEFEQFQPITAAAVTICPKCKRKRVERKISIGAAVLFKGGGFYETDYRSDAYRKAEEAEKKESQKAPPAAAKSDAAATESKKLPADKSAPASATPTPTPPSAAEPPRVPPATQPNTVEKKSAREGRGVGNLKQAAARRAKPTSRTSKPARKNKRT